MIHLDFFRISMIFCFGLLFINPHFSIGQEVTVKPAGDAASNPDAEFSETVEPLNVKLSVNEVRLDVVVLDNKGRSITDLTAADFEIYQNRLPQAVVSSVYINNKADTPTKPAATRRGSSNLPPLPASDLKKEDVRRTIVFVVDNLSMQSEELYHTKTSIKRFVETQMQPYDLVSIIRTSYGTSAINFFSSDKRQITARVDGIPFAIPLEAQYDTQKFTSDEHPDFLRRREIIAGALNDDLKARIYGYQISTVSYSIRALKDMPGRKILFFMSSMPTITIYSDYEDGFSQSIPSENLTEMNDYQPSPLEPDPLPMDGYWKPAEAQSYKMYTDQMDWLADEALRSGIVVYTLDTRGLSVPDTQRQKMAAPRGIERVPDPYYADGLNGLSKRTGGLFVENSNFFFDGVGKEANNMIAGYYLLSYAPPSSTFETNWRSAYNRVEIKVKRKGAVVYTRDGFYGRIEDRTDSVEPGHPLQDAVFSPFKHAGLDVNMAAGYIKDAKAGYLIRSWIHLDPKDVRIVETEDGGARVDIETVCMTSDISGYIHDFRAVKYTFDIKPENKSENLGWIQKHGIRFALRLPVKKPGLYTVRIAVHDTESGNIGSAWQHLEVPDLGKKGLALSDVFMITSADNLGWMLSDSVKEDSEEVFTPTFQSEEVRSPALRTYIQGDGLQILAVLYNADVKAVTASKIEIRHVLYKDGVEYKNSEPVPLVLKNAGSSDGILILKRFTIGADIPPGDYILQLIATDKNIKKQEGVAVRILNFSIVAGN